MKSVSSRFEPAPTNWEKKVPPGRSTRVISGHTSSTGCLLTTRSKDSAGNGSGATSATWTTRPPRGARFCRASSAFGGHDSVAARTAGGCVIPASTSPPPVWMSSAARARAIRSAIIRA
jgi:hypothetical protein